MNEIEKRICWLLRELGVNETYKGFYYTVSAVELCLMQPERLLLVTKLVYPDVAKLFHTNWRAVERDIRTISAAIWRRNKDHLEILAHTALTQRPHNAKLLAILTAAWDSE